MFRPFSVFLFISVVWTGCYSSHPLSSGEDAGQDGSSEGDAFSDDAPDMRRPDVGTDDAGLDAVSVDADISQDGSTDSRPWDASTDSFVPVDAMPDSPRDTGADTPIDARMDAGPSCPMGFIDCGGVCRDLSVDSNHCGTCGLTCAAPTTCNDGVCGCPAGAGSIVCGGACADTLTHSDHCGGCGTVCPDGATCEDGLCACSEGVACGGRCVMIADDPQHCGGCGQVCPALAMCSAGDCVCSDPTQLACGGACVQTQDDSQNCGSCGVTCRTRVCDAGDCLEATNVSVGDDHTCIATNAGEVYCWGQNVGGMLGDGTFENRTTPTRVLGLTDIVEVSISGGKSCALDTSGAVWCWGFINGQLTPEIPQRASMLPPATTLSVTWSSICVTSDGRVYCWTPAGPTLLTEIEGVIGAVRVSGGLQQGCALTTSADVWCWGANGDGQLGRGFQSRPQPAARVPGLPSSIVKVSTSTGHVCALSAVGDIYCWGNNWFGSVGNGELTTNVLSPYRVPFGPAVDVIAGGLSSCAIDTMGQGWCWGANGWGKLGIGNRQRQSRPVRVLGLVDAVSMASEKADVCWIVEGGNVRCSGWNLYGGHGDGTTDPHYRLTETVW